MERREKGGKEGKCSTINPEMVLGAKLLVFYVMIIM